VTARFRLRPGRYVVVASTFDPGQDGEFLMRVFCTGRIQAGSVAFHFLSVENFKINL
jgi:hypothetical protein